jgi:hypothetical protein
MRSRRTFLGASVLVVACLAGPWSAWPARAADPPPRRSTPVWAWCGVDPDQPDAIAAAESMHRDSGVDVTFGPCVQPTGNYTPADPGDRYVTPAKYHRLVTLNAAHGMKTVVYDARLWSENSITRSAAIEEWRPQAADVAAWDLGDEFDPALPEWAILRHRWDLVESDATLRTGVHAFANFTSFALNEAIRDIPYVRRLLSFATYYFDRGAGRAGEFAGSTDTLMCGVNAFDHDDLHPTPASIVSDMTTLRRAGCNQFLIFGGHRVYGTDHFGTQSLTDPSGNPTNLAAAVLQGALEPDAGVVGLQPARLLDTRPGAATVDGASSGIGRLASGSVTELQVGGRAGIPAGAAAAELAITVVGPDAAGFVTAYPCGTTPPNAASATYVAARLVTTSVTVRLDPAGKACLFTLVGTDLVVDATAVHPAGSWFVPVAPARLVDTRTTGGSGTIDGAFSATGRLPDNSVTAVQIAGRAGVPTGAAAATMTVAVTGAPHAGYVVLYPCGAPVPLAANVVWAAGETVTNSVTAKLASDGTVCIYAQTGVDVIVDLAGYHPADTSFVALDPARIMDTRAGGITVDGRSAGIGLRPAGSITELVVGGRGGVSTAAGSAVVDITVLGAVKDGFVTAFPCGSPQPNAAVLSFRAGAIVANATTVRLGTGGKVCVYVQQDAQVLVDVNGYQP